MTKRDAKKVQNMIAKAFICRDKLDIVAGKLQLSFKITNDEIEQTETDRQPETARDAAKCFISLLGMASACMEQFIENTDI